MNRPFLGACLGVAALLGAVGGGARCGAKPPDLPAQQTILVTPQSDPQTGPLGKPLGGQWMDLATGEVPTPVPHPESALLPTVLIPQTPILPLACPTVGPLLLTLHPFVSFLTEEVRDSSSVPLAGDYTCPYLRHQAVQHIPASPGKSTCPSVLENLTNLEKAATALRKAQIHLQQGDTAGGLRLVEEVRRLCPGSRYDAQAEELLRHVVAGVYQAPGTVATGRESIQALQDTWDGLCALVESSRRWVEAVKEGLQVTFFESDPQQTREPQLLEESKRLRQESLPILLDTRVTVQFAQVPLQAVLENLCSCECVPVEIDLLALRTHGVPLTQPITVHADNVPFRQVLAQVTHQAGLVYLEKEGGITVTCWHDQRANLPTVATGSAEESEPAAQTTCPRAQRLHARRLTGVREQVRGLMKACHLALADARFEKAAELARQAHALDPQEVEADPAVYKLHLLDVEAMHRRRLARGDSRPAGYQEEQEAGPVAPGQQIGPRERMCPYPPPVDPGVSASLDAVLRQVEQEMDAPVCGSCPRATRSCPFQAAVDEVRDWVDQVPKMHGSLIISAVGSIHVRMIGEKCCYNMQWAGWIPLCWKSPRTPQDEKTLKALEESCEER